MSNIKWRIVVARILIIVLAGNPVIVAAQGIEHVETRRVDYRMEEELQRIRTENRRDIVEAARRKLQKRLKNARLAAAREAARKQSANGTQVIDIAEASQRGVSHNQFAQFDVSEDGIILNNSQGPALSVLGGWTDGNRRLAGGTASLILAEVTGSDRSSLLGYTEVLGDAAEFVLANPNGISCDGCGFINIPRVVLATGTPDLINGELTGINISGGDVSVDGAGLNASNVSKFDILTRAMTLNAELYANELNIRTGNNYYDFKTLQSQGNSDQADNSADYQFALDASALGAMYANNISLIGTEAGLGVRSEGLISSTDSLQLTASGRLELKDTIAGGDLALRSQQSDVTVEGSTYGENVNIELAGTLHNSGVIAAADTMQLTAAELQQQGDVIAGISQQGEWLEDADQQIDISGAVVNQGRIISQGQQDLSAQELQNTAEALVQGGVTTVTTDLLENSGTLNSHALALDATTVDNAGHIQAQELAIDAQQFKQTDGAVYQSGADGHLSLTGGELQLDAGVLVAEGSAEVNASGQIRNSADWLMADDISIDAADIINSGTLQLLGQANITADSLENSGNMLFFSEQIAQLAIANTLDNQGGLLQFTDDAMVSATEINNDDGQIVHTGAGTMSLQATQLLNNSGGLILSQNDMKLGAQRLENEAGTLSAEGLDINATALKNTENGIIQANQLNIEASTVSNDSDATINAQQLTLTAESLDNAGVVLASGEQGESFRLQTDTLTNQGLIEGHGENFTLSSSQLDNEQGRIYHQGTGVLALTATDELNNNAGEIFSAGQLAIDGGAVRNSAGVLLAGTEVTITADSLSNQSGVVSAADQLSIVAIDFDNSLGKVKSTAIALDIEQSLNNSEGLINGQTLVLSASGLNNSHGTILAAGTGEDALQTRDIGQLNNDHGTVASHGRDWTLTLDKLSNDEGRLLHLGEGTFTLSLADTLTNSGTIASAANLTLNADNVANAGSLSASNKLQLDAADITNSGSLSAGHLEVINFDLLQNSGRIESNSARYSGDTIHNLEDAVLVNAGVDADALQLNVAELNNSGIVHNSSQDMTLSGNLTNSGNIIHAGSGSLVLGSSGTINNADGSITSAGIANIQNSIIGAGTVYVEQGMLLGNSDTFINNSQLYTKGDIEVSSGLNNQGGSLLSDGQLIINTTDNVTNSGTLQGQNISLTAGDLDNTGGVITSVSSGHADDSAQIDVASLTNSDGTIQTTNTNFTISTRSGELNNSGGQISHNGTGSLTLNSAADLNQQSGVVQTSGQLVLNTAGDLDNSAGRLTASQYELFVAGNLNNEDGRIVGAGSGVSSIESGTLLNRSGHIATNGSDLTLNTGALNNNAGSILLAGTGNLAISADSVANEAASSRIISNGAINFSSGSGLNNAGQISSANLLTLNATTIGNSGVLASRAGSVDIASNGALTNSGTVSGASGVSLDVDTLNNRNGRLQSDGDFDINVNNLIVGQIQARDITLNSSNSIELSSAESISASGDMDLRTDDEINNSGKIVASGTLDIEAKELSNTSGALIRSGGNGVLDLDTLTNGGIISSNAVLTLDVANTTNTGTLAAGHQLHINGTVDNSNLLFANNLLSIDGNVTNTGNIYSNGDAVIAGSNILNEGGSIAASRNLSLSGGITNTHTGTLIYKKIGTESEEEYVGNGLAGLESVPQDTLLAVAKERRTITTHEAVLSGKQGVIAAGGNMLLNGTTQNIYSTISAGGVLTVSGQNFDVETASNRVITEVTTHIETWAGGCMLEYYNGDRPIGCAEPGAPLKIRSRQTDTLAPVTTYTGGSYGTVYAGSITGELKDRLTLTNANPLAGDLVDPVDTDASGSSGSASRGSKADVTGGNEVAVTSSNGSAQSITAVERSTGADDWTGNDAIPGSDEVIAPGPEKLESRPTDSAVETGDPAQQTGLAVQAASFTTPNLADRLKRGDGTAPEVLSQPSLGQGLDGGSELAGQSNPDLIIKDMVDEQEGTVTSQQNSMQLQRSAQNESQDDKDQSEGSTQQVGQNVFMTDEQMRVLTEDLGFDGDAIHEGQQGLYTAISRNDLLDGGVSMGADGTIDITANGGFDINSGMKAGEGLILRSENGLNMGDLGFFDSEKMLGLELGGDFTNTAALESDNLWLDIGGDFTNLGSLTGNDVLSISAEKDLVNQSLLSGDNVILEAGGDIINRTEFTQHTQEFDDGNSRTYTTVGDAPEIISNNSLSMTAGNNIDLQGSDLRADGDISLNAAKDVLLGAVERLSSRDEYFKGGHKKREDRTYDVVNLEAGGNLSIVAGNDLHSEGAQFSAGGLAALAAGNAMDLLAVVESHYDAKKTTKKSTFSTRVTETESRHEEVQGTSITAENILLNATVDSEGKVVGSADGDITVVGGELNAGQNIIAFGDDINVTAETYQDYSYSESSKSSFGGLKSKSKAELAQDDLLAGSQLTAGSNIQLNAANDIHILASGLSGENIGLTAENDVVITSGEESSIRESRSQSGGFLTGGSLFASTETLTGEASTTANSSVIDARGNIIVDAGSATVVGSVLGADGGIQVSTDTGDIQVLAAQETTETYSSEQTIKVGFEDALDTLGRPSDLVQTGGGRLQLSLGSASYDSVDFSSETVSHKGSELVAGNGIHLDSAADIVIEGSGVQAGDDVNLLADGDVVVKEVQDTYRETTEEIHGSADLSLVVQNQAVEVVNATKALEDAKDQVKQAEADYRQYRREKDQLEATLAELEADYEAGAPGITHGDVVELRNLLDDVKGDEEWYIAGIATASANVVSKSTLLMQQTAAAAQSTASYGFNAGLQLDIAATKTDSSMEATSSVGSTISGNNINVVTGGDGKSGNTLIQGSALDATQNLNIATGDLGVLASQDSMRSQTDTQSGSIVIAQTFAGAASGPTVNANLNSSQQQDRETTHTNSSLTADNLNIATTGDTTVVGGNLHGTTAVNLDIGGDLTLESVQDRFSGSNKSLGVSGGVSLGGVYTNERGAGASSREVKTTAIGKSEGVSGVNGGVNASSGRYSGTETVVSSITGGTVNVDVDGHTQVTGSVIAAVDSEGNDTGELQLSTGSLEIANLTNRSYSSNQSIGVNASVGLSDAADAGDQNQSDTDLALNSSNYTNQNESSQSLGKTLATIGEGSITVGGEATDPEGLNRDIDEVNKELYAVDRQQGNMDLTVDHRLLSEDGRKQIAEDAKRTQILGTALIDIVESSVSLIGVGEGESSVREHAGNTQDYFTATKNFTQNPENAEHIATLENSDATPEQKQAAYTALVNEIATFMGVDPTEAKVLMENDPQFAGAHSRDSGTIYVDDMAHEDATAAVNTVGHEAQHYLDNQENPDAEQTQQYQDNRENYADIMGAATEDYVNFNFSQNGHSLADSNNHSMGTTSEERARNEALVAGNSTDFRQEDEQALDYYLTKKTVNEVKSCLAGATCNSAEQQAAVVENAEALSRMLDSEFNQLCSNNPTSDACRTAVNSATQYIGMEDAWDILNDDVARSSKNTFDHVFNSDGAAERLNLYYNTVDNRGNFFGAGHQYEQNIGLGAEWYGGAEFVTRAPLTGLGADGNLSWVTFGAGALTFPSTYNPFTSSEIYEWRSEAGNVLMNAGFDNFRALYNQDVTDPVAWDINQLRSEQQVLQPVHEKYLGDRSFFIDVSNFFTNSEAALNPVRLLPTAQEQTIEGGIDTLNYESRVRFGCNLLGHSETQGCRP